ncbi:hypothetical protein [Methylomicrobium sp. Wu6]|uniref:hypothetical protein n=1 Tax=Methylomicrobium sp. Wu6 TaxID=3107928 RepID=UPI002DD61CBB|nr:hypothetical protein [Methylomicrobium sp. Wu6]MEC4747460.1 hypothetical protein [Methylomicrobium sp. Wu6]
MSEKETKKASGGKLSRSETVTVRLDPKLRYLAELAARKQRRTLSSFIEWAIEDSLNRVEIYHGSGYNGDPSLTVHDEINTLWDVDEADRFCKLAMSYPELLTHEEQRLWKLIKELDMAIPGEKDEQTWSLLLDGKPIYPAVRALWGSLWDCINGDLQHKDLLQIMERTIQPLSFWLKKQPGKGNFSTNNNTDFDDDIPF